MSRGKIISFNAADALGDIELDDGVVVRFGLGALPARLKPEPGTKVIIEDMAPDRRGRLKATRITTTAEAALRESSEPSDTLEARAWIAAGRSFGGDGWPTTTPLRSSTGSTPPVRCASRSMMAPWS